MVNRANGSEKSNANLTQVYPTQGQIEVQSVPTLFELYNGSTFKSVTGPAKSNLSNFAPAQF